MALPYVCCACRAHAQRFGLSGLERTGWKARPQHTFQFTKITNASNRQHQRGVATQNVADEVENEEPKTGRYSRRSVLRPEHVISQLQQPSEEIQQPLRNYGPRIRLPEELRQQMSRFVEVARTEKEDAEAWNILLEIRSRYGENQACIKDLGKMKLFRNAFGALVLRHATRFVDSVYNDQDAKQHTLAPSKILGLFPEFREEKSHVASDTVWIVATRILETQATHNSNIKALSASMDELMTLWWMLTRAHLRSREPAAVSTDLDWSFLPKPDVLRESLDNKRPFEKAYELIFAMLVPEVQYRGMEHPLHLSRSALVTEHLLHLSSTSESDRNVSTFGTNPTFAPFAALLDTLRRTCAVPAAPLAILEKFDVAFPAEIQDLYQAVLTRYKIERTNGGGAAQLFDRYSTRRIVKDLLEAQQSVAQVFAGMNVEGLSVHKILETDNSASGLFTRQYLSRLANAIKTRHGSTIETLAAQVIDMPTERPEIKLSDQVYETTMLACMLLKKRALMLDVWNAFLAQGRKPTARTFTMLMTGARHLRDVKAVEVFWHQMISRKIKPDTVAWSTRVFGLIRGGEVEKGVAALVEMGRMWQKQASHGTTGDLARPTVAIMNSAISALAASRKADHLIPQVLSWGRQFDIKPDESTFNALLALAARSGQTEESLMLLEQMQGLGVKPNSTTWTVIITDLLTNGSLDGLSDTEIQGKIRELLDSIDSLDGSGIDVKGYATLIDRLLKRYDNAAAAQSVLDHMLGKGIEPTAHIYTILLTAYFDKKPQPDFDAIDAMLAHIQSQNHGHGARLDDYFWDRLIEGHARHHHIVGVKRCIDLLHRMTGLNQKPSWPSLGLVARALVERNDMNRLAQLVHDVRVWDRSPGINNVWHKKGNFGRVDFWRLVISTGVLRQEGITRVEQLITPRAKVADSAATFASMAG